MLLNFLDRTTSEINGELRRWCLLFTPLLTSAVFRKVAWSLLAATAAFLTAPIATTKRGFRSKPCPDDGTAVAIIKCLVVLDRLN